MNDTEVTLNSSNFRFLEECNSTSITEYNDVESVVYVYVVPIIAVIGISGNVLNLAVLTHRSWRKLGRLERFVHSGLMALACADMGVCVFLIPLTITRHYRHRHLQPETINFHLIYEFFSGFFINMFMIASTLLTTSLAIGRYFAIICPFEMRARINSCCSKTIIIVIAFVSVGFNLPRFWINKIESCQFNDSLHYQIGKGALTDGKDNQPLKIYTCLYFAVAIAIPLCVLSFCNIFLIRHLKQPVHNHLRASYYSNSNLNMRRKQEVASRLMTRVLIILVIMHICLVTPAELVYFLSEVTQLSRNRKQTAKTIIAVVNLLEIVNFSFNFVLYCALNVHFRQILNSLCAKCFSGICYNKTWRPHENDDFIPTDFEMEGLKDKPLYKNHRI